MRSYTIDEFCALHNVSRGLFYKLQKSGEAPQTFRVGQHQRISEEANRQWIAERTARTAIAA
jgi:excisionase family DNA binding protein